MPPAYSDAGFFPWYLAQGDFNGDGKTDLVVIGELPQSEYVSYRVFILLGKGDGTFRPPLSIADPLDVEPQALIVNDFNDDRRPDIAVAFNTGSLYPRPGGVLLLLNNGNASFQSPVKIMLPGVIESLAAADLDGDGKADLVVGNDGNVSVLFGNGDGTFQAATLYGAGFGVGTVAIGDVNGDGLPDIVTGNYWTKDFSVLLNAGHPPFVSENSGTTLLQPTSLNRK